MSELRVLKRVKKIDRAAWFGQTTLQKVINGVLILLLLACLVPVFKWAVIDAQIRGSERCVTEGACWVFIKVRLLTFAFGFYETHELWRPVFVLSMWTLALVTIFRASYNFTLKILPFFITLLPLLSWGLLDGRWFGLPYIETAKWGGLLLSLMITLVSLSMAFPLGLLLALGRMSRLPLIKAGSVAFIELWRGVPLIAVLFMSSVMLPLVLPPGTEVDKLIRVFVGVSLFTSAYLAEVIRSGLNGVPKGQGEAASALGLGARQRLFLVVLPQALQAVIPSLVNSCISLFKDTSLVVVVGMFDLLGTVQQANTDPYWLGYSTEGYMFAGLIYWGVCFALSRFSLQLEKVRNV
ncbi:MAG: amino acid ABC transporter permease [Chitinophagaceae bacterium]|nr:amino acid ABC transporter permease [Oligoflexus sp.]